MNKMIFGFLITGFIAAVPQTAAKGQFGVSSDGITATGTEKLPVKPEKLRLIMWIKAQGMDGKAAVLKLAEHRERVMGELESMKADKSSIVFSASRVTKGDSDPNAQRNMRAQMQMMRAQGRGAVAASEPPVIFTATCALKADWPLPVKEGDALALLPTTLRDQISTRDLAGEKNKPEMSEEVREKLEEMEAAMSEYRSYQTSDSQSPQITFVASVTEDMKKKATQAAFKKAVKDAESLSSATGITLGKLNSVTFSNSGMDTILNNAAYNAMRGWNEAEGFPAHMKGNEGPIVSDNNADSLSFNVTVAVSYVIE